MNLVSAPHIHEHDMVPRSDPRRGDCCGGFEVIFDGYYCETCDFFAHKKCGGVSLPLIHNHLMIPYNDLRRGNCCGGLETISDGYYCETCDFFVHKSCAEPPEYIKHPSHSIHTLKLQNSPWKTCDLCGLGMEYSIIYGCDICNFYMHIRCGRYPPPEVIDTPETHGHILTLVKEYIIFKCDNARCGKIGAAFHYKCHECDISFHINCVWQPSEVKYPREVNHPYHPLHALKLIKDGPPDYSDGKCRLCQRKVDDEVFYHCSSCNFSLDLPCFYNPPPKSILDLKTHDHELTFMPRLISFTCNACGLNGDRSPYVCVQCEFMIHRDCFSLPRLININRHDHRVSRTSVLGVVNSVCGVCRRKVDWIYGGYSCQKCPKYVVHSKCATRSDVWNGKELEGTPEEAEDTKPYVIIDDNTIQHFSHKTHYLRLNIDGTLHAENKRCSACTHPIYLQSFYSCMVCEFILHQNCAELPRRKWHFLHNERLTLETSIMGRFCCDACQRESYGFRYKEGGKKIDVRCASISEPFNHPSHPQHPLYSISSEEEISFCNGCNLRTFKELRCIEDDCGYVLDFKCATLPQVVKHKVDNHPLTLCYGENASGKYWCELCEKETNPKTWFYTSKDHQATLHVNCVLGDFAGFMPGTTIKLWDSPYEVVLNNTMSRPFCWSCKSRCIPPIILKRPGCSDQYFCSSDCETHFYSIFRY